MGNEAIQIGRVGGNVTIMNVTLNFAFDGGKRVTTQAEIAQCFRTEQEGEILALIRQIAARVVKSSSPNQTKRPRKTAVK